MWDVWPLAGRHRQLREKMITVHLQQLRQLGGVRKTVATDILLEDLQQQPLRHVWLLCAAGFWNSLVGGSGFYRALLQDAVQLAVKDGVRNWVKGCLMRWSMLGIIHSLWLRSCMPLMWPDWRWP